MNRDREPLEPTNDSDALNAYLDRLTGLQDEPSAPLSPGMRGAVDRLFALADTADRDEAAFHLGREPIMTTVPIQLPLTGSPGKTRRSPAIRAHVRRWTQPMHMLSTAALVVLAVAGVIFAATNGNGHNNGNGGNGGVFGAVPFATVPVNANTVPTAATAGVPIATVPDDATTSSLPYPTAAECTATPRSKEEVAQIIRTPPDPASVLSGALTSQGAVDPSTATEVMNTYRQFQACMHKGVSYAFSASLVTEDTVRAYFYGTPKNRNDQPKPMSDAQIAHQLEVNIFFAPPAATPAPLHLEKATVLTIFPGDIVSRAGLPEGVTLSATPPSIVGPLIVATAYPVHPLSREITHGPPVEITFVNVDGHWLINRIAETRGGGAG